MRRKAVLYRVLRSVHNDWFFGLGHSRTGKLYVTTVTTYSCINRTAASPPARAF